MLRQADAGTPVMATCSRDRLVDQTIFQRSGAGWSGARATTCSADNNPCWMRLRTRWLVTLSFAAACDMVNH